jgi:hypothetical protein
VAARLKDEPWVETKVLFEALCVEHPGRFEPGQLRTLQRRARLWHAQHGASREVLAVEAHGPEEAGRRVRGDPAVQTAAPPRETGGRVCFSGEPAVETEDVTSAVSAVEDVSAEPEPVTEFSAPAERAAQLVAFPSTWGGQFLCPIR